ncbi:MAG: DUF3576 domain-containing protein [Alphaproteobacteria bacterium]|nr:DUF3576 domain-containing protein [Alphaproteobacteria bacterium]MDX5369343.1 DUF3576 domain-containing protein [Alphaproteobacteria bacterium]MDX5464024.1 DUF3576 domain-containing protein [Alphaproteobacteria bacterium]
MSVNDLHPTPMRRSRTPYRPGARLIRGVVATVALSAVLAACGESERVYPYKDPLRGPVPYSTNDRAREDKVFGRDGLNIFGGDEEQAPTGTGIAVNAYLWRASLDTLSFMPLASADPFGGVIITDWYAAPEAQNERMKANVFILDRRLRADGLRVALFRQVRGENGEWVNAPVSDAATKRLEDTILTRARQLRLDDVG